MKKLIAVLAALVAVPLLLAAPAGADTTVRISGNTVDGSAGENGSTGWWFNRDANTSTLYEFNLEKQSIGTGALEVLPIQSSSASDKFIAELFMFSDLAALDLSVDYNLGPDSDASQVYVNVYATDPTSAPEKFYDCRFNFVANGDDTANSWQTLSFEQGTVANSVTTRTGAAARDATYGPCPSTMSAMPAGSQVRAISINFGDTSTNDAGMSVHLDNVVVGDVTYDFEVPVQVKDACKDGGYVEYGFDNQGQCVSSLQANANK